MTQAQAAKVAELLKLGWQTIPTPPPSEVGGPIDMIKTDAPPPLHGDPLKITVHRCTVSPDGTVKEL